MVDQAPVDPNAPVTVAVVVPAPKKPWESKTIVIASIGFILTAIVPFFPGLSEYQAWINSNGVFISGIWTVLTIFLRSVTKGAISLED